MQYATSTVLSADRRLRFRSRLQRALCLWPSEPDDLWSPPKSTEGDNTEDESLQEENNCYSPQGHGNLVGRIEETAVFRLEYGTKT